MPQTLRVPLGNWEGKSNYKKYFHVQLAQSNGSVSGTCWTSFLSEGLRPWKIEGKLVKSNSVEGWILSPSIKNISFFMSMAWTQTNTARLRLEFADGSEAATLIRTSKSSLCLSDSSANLVTFIQSTSTQLKIQRLLQGPKSGIEVEVQDSGVGPTKDAIEKNALLMFSDSGLLVDWCCDLKDRDSFLARWPGTRTSMSEAEAKMFLTEKLNPPLELIAIKRSGV